MKFFYGLGIFAIAFCTCDEQTNAHSVQRRSRYDEALGKPVSDRISHQSAPQPLLISPGGAEPVVRDTGARGRSRHGAQHRPPFETRSSSFPPPAASDSLQGPPPPGIDYAMLTATFFIQARGAGSSSNLGDGFLAVDSAAEPPTFLLASIATACFLVSSHIRRFFGDRTIDVAQEKTR